MDKVSFNWVKQEFFSDEHKKLVVKKGEVLLDPKHQNTRLFLVTKGKFQGYLSDAEIGNYPVFEASENKFIGVYSYFSDDHYSYSKVIAVEDSEVYYYDKTREAHTPEEMQRLSQFHISIVVNELYARQYFAKKMAQERYNDSQRLLKAEKMSTLGQMAAGVAHELNNSIGVLEGSMGRLSDFIHKCVDAHGDSHFQKFFEIGKKGQEMSSEQARSIRKEYEKIKELTDAQARKLSKTGIPIEEVKAILQKDAKKADRIAEFWEVGCTLHDMEIAAKHSTHVVRSVKQLGVTEHQWSKEVNINDTISEAMVILKNLTKRVNTTISLDEYLPHTEACPGQLVQVWINLVKNGIESMIQSHTENPELKIASNHDAQHIIITVSDNGPGIPNEIKQRIFEPSFTTKVDGLNFGLGLGLAVVQRIVTEHDAVIEVVSEPGHTKFTVKIPLIA